MPAEQEIRKAYLQEIVWKKDGQVQEVKPDKIPVQFNPQSLKLNYANQKAGGDQRGGSAIQFVGRGTTKLSLELLFDVTIPLADGSVQDDVGFLLQKVERFIKPDPSTNVSKDKKKEELIPPGLRFVWGTFLFDGVVDSIDETIDFFSADGKPLRATVALSISRQDITIRPVQGNAPPGTQPQKQARQGDSVQQMAAREGQEDSWKQAAAVNGIENPRQLAPGTPLDLSAAGGVSGGFSGGISGGVSGGFSGGFSASAGLGISGSASASVGAGLSASLGGGVSGGIGGGVSGGISGGIGGGVAGGIGISGGAGLSGGIGGSISGGIGGGLSAGSSGKLDIGVAGRLGFGASTRADFSASAAVRGGVPGGPGAPGIGVSASATVNSTRVR